MAGDLLPTVIEQADGLHESLQVCVQMGVQNRHLPDVLLPIDRVIDLGHRPRP